MRLFILFYLIFISIVVHSQISLNTTGAAPHPSAAWDIQYSDKGILIPRVNLTQTTSPSPITSPATSLLVFNEATVSDVSPGYYYWNGTRWIRLLGNDKAWLLEGNAGTNPSSNFLGTIDAVDLVFRTNNSERVRVTSAGNVGINTTSPAYRLTIAGTGDVFGVDNTATFFARNSSGNYEAYLWPRWSDNIMYLNYGSGGFHIRNNSSTSTMFMTNNNNVGIGTISPVSKLHVVGKTTLTRDNVAECCGNDATLALGENTQSTGRRASISFHNGNEAEGQIILIQNTLNGVSSRRIRMFDNQSQGLGLELTGRLWYGNSGTRTETRNDAGLQGNAGAQSGFYETSSPVNFPSGASSWWHLIDCRHSNNANNYAMQLAGSFFDQRLYFRKTNGNAAQAWTEVITGNYLQNNIITVESTSQLAVSNAFNIIPGMSVTVNNLQPGDRVILSDMSAQDAVDFPNIVARGERVRVEVNVEPGKTIATDLAERGYPVQEREGENSGLHVIVVRPDELDGAADKRREGIVRTTSAH